MRRGAWWATAHGVAKSRTRLSDSPFSVFPPSLHHKSVGLFFHVIIYGLVTFETV